MKRKITLSIALVLSVALLSLMSSDSTTSAAQSRDSFADTGTITLAPNQVLRLTVACSTRRPMTVKFDTLQHVSGGCTGGVCGHTIASRTTSVTRTLMPGETASFDIIQTPNSSGVRGGVSVSSADAHVNALILDGDTGVASMSNKLFVGGLSWDTNDEGLR